MSVFLLSADGREQTRVCDDVLDTIAASETELLFLGLGTEVDRALIRLCRSGDRDVLSLNELDAEIEADGCTYTVIDAFELRHNGSGWDIDGRLVDDLATAVHIVLTKRHADDRHELP